MKKMFAIFLVAIMLFAAVVPAYAANEEAGEGKLAGLSPEAVFDYFEQITKIPRGSGNTKQISDFLVRFAKEHNLDYIQDELNNVIIFEEGTGGMENHDPIILQGHMDMVAVKDENCDINLETEGIQADHDDTYVFANGTSLGGDDGIGVAMILAVLADGSIAHPPIEAIITVDEETGMFGAAGIDLSMLKGRTMINLDYEEDGVFMVSGAGGCGSRLTFAVNRENTQGEAFVITVEGLLGGHSGVEIDKNHANAIKVIAELLSRIRKEASLNIAELEGGSKENAIPTAARATVIIGDLDRARLNELAEAMQAEIRENYNDPEAVVRIESTEDVKEALTAEDTDRIINIIIEAPNGVQKFSEDIQGLVQTSLNLGIVKLNNEVTFNFSIRSSVAAEKEELKESLKKLAEGFGGSYEESGDYPAWEFRQDSPLRERMEEIYREMFGSNPIVTAVHGGLECGILAEKIPDLDAVSIGPQLFDVHTTRERLEIASVERTYNFLLEVLNKL